MRLLLAYANHNPRLGGGQTFMVNLLGALRRRGFDCELFWIGVAPWGYSSSHMSSGTLAELVDTVIRRRIDVVHAAVQDWESGVGLVRRMSPRTALVLTNHGEVYRGWNSRNCDALVGCSAWTAAAQQAETDLPVQVVFNGIDTDRFIPAPRATSGGPIVGWVGRGAVPGKCLGRFAAIAPVLKHAGARIWVADPDGAANGLPEIVRVLGPAADRWGGVAYESMPAFYQEIAASGGCVVSTSPSEGLPLALVEAQACGCPVIAADVRGVNEVVDPRHGGILFHPDLDPVSLAGLIRESLADGDAMRARGRAGSEYVRDRFSLDRMATEYVQVYTEARAALRSRTRRARGRPVRVPLRDWRRVYWPVATSLHAAMLDFHRSGQRRLARLAAWESLLALPTIYLRWSRLSRLIRATIPSV
jgi:glycosyltransferase involved in cell wall biosynthesis